MTRFQKRPLLLIPVLIIVMFLYYPNISAGFTNWDDQIHVTENKRVQTLTWESAAELFVPNTEYMYHPVTMISYAVDWSLGNGSPAIFHLTSILIHLFNIVLVYRIIKRISGNSSAALIVALLFGIHPVNVETVSWVSARKDLLYSFFVLCGLDLYAVFRNGVYRRSAYLGMTAAFVFGLLSKPTMVVFPLLLFLFDWWERRPFNRTMIMEKAPLIVIAAGFGIFTMLLSNSDSDGVTIISLFKWQHQVLMVCYAAVFYIGKLLVPVNLTAIYHYPVISSGALSLWYYAAPMLVISIGFILTVARNRWRFLVFGIGLYIIPLLLVLQVLPFNNTSLVAERYAYISSIGIMFIAVMVVKQLLAAFGENEPFWQGIAASLLVITVTMFAIGTMVRVSVWKDSISLFTGVIEKDQTVWIAYANRAIDRIKIEQYQGAMEDVTKALKLHPARKKLYSIRGNIHFFLKDYRSAVTDFDSVAFSSKVKPYELYNKGAAHYYLKEYDSSLAYYSKTLKADSSFALAYLGYGLIQWSERRAPAIAVQYFNECLRYDPVKWDAYYFRAAAHLDQGHVSEALKDIAEALKINPNIPDDSLSVRIDSAVTRLSNRIVELNSVIDKGNRSASVIGELSRSYEMIGDSIRAGNVARLLPGFGQTRKK